MPRFNPDHLIEVGTAIFAAAGTPEKEARKVAELLVEANCTGHDSHGIIRIPQYLDAIEKGYLVPGAEVEILRESPVSAVLDGHWGFGQVVLSRGVDMALEKAEKSGLAAVAVRRENHVGRLGSYVEWIARQRMIGLLFVNGTAPCRMAPWGGTEARHGTNPLAAGIPTAAGESIVLDMTTTVVAEGKVRVKRHRGEKTPDGWLLDAEGNPTNDPSVLYTEPRGTILPLGGSVGHKGYGLNVAVELLAGALSGSGCVGQDRQFSNGAFLIALDVGQFVPLEDFFREVGGFVAFVKSSPLVEEADEILMPGEIELRTKKQREEEGIFVEEETWGQVVERAEKLGVRIEGE